MRLRAKAALITGAGGGIGRATAVLFAQEGAQVLLTDLNPTAGAETLAAVRAVGGQAEFVAGDVGDAADAARIVQRCIEAFGRIDVLFNCAGITVVGTVESLSPEDFDRVYHANVRGPFLMCKYAVPHMRRQKSGSIINMGSTASLVAAVNMISYGVSKSSLLGLTRSVAADYATEGVRANCLCPGATATPLLKQIMRERPPEQTAAFVAKHPIGRFAEPEEVAGAVVFLASDESAYMTGAVLALDGGMTAV